MQRNGFTRRLRLVCKVRQSLPRIPHRRLAARLKLKASASRPQGISGPRAVVRITRVRFRVGGHAAHGLAHRLGSLGSGAVTALALAVQQGLAAVVGVVIAHEFGRGAETDGFFAAYGVFIVLALAATASRAVLLPPLARARAEHRLGSETTAYALALALVALPLLVVSIAGCERHRDGCSPGSTRA